MTSSIPDLAFLLVALGGMAFLAFRMIQAWRGNARCRGWPETQGRVLQSGVVLGRKIGTKTTSYPMVIYQYEVDGKTYQSDQITMAPRVGGSLVAKKASRYPVGHPVSVAYNPQNPAEAVLEKRGAVGFYLWIFLAFLFYVLVRVFGMI